MVRLAAEFELPAGAGTQFALAMKLLAQRESWELVGIERRPEDPPCPACGCPMQWDPQFAGYVCHHPE